MTIELLNYLNYPITQLQSDSVQRLCKESQRALANTGVSIFPDFLSSTAVNCIATESYELLPQAHHMQSKASVYPKYKNKEDFPQDHPVRINLRTSLHTIAYDQFPEQSLIKKLYEWDSLMEFVRLATGRDKIYRYADDMGALNLSIMYAGDELGWHFDESDFTVTISLQISESGGEFECASIIRSSDNENYGAVKQVLVRQSDRLNTVPMLPGTLILFEGKHSLHRVTSVTGSKPRIVALLGYSTKPDTVSSSQLRMARYGRP